MADVYNIKEILKIRDVLVSRKETLAVAESVTSGHLQAALSLAPDASKFYQGGISTYNIGQKSRHLKIEPIHGLSCNCVSERIAEEMAKGAVLLFSSDWGIAVTGYAVPVPELGIHDLFAFYSFFYRDNAVHAGKLESRGTDGYQVQVEYANLILKEFKKFLIASYAMVSEHRHP
jgi:nicotinamide-nucleotide amidase